MTIILLILVSFLIFLLILFLFRKALRAERERKKMYFTDPVTGGYNREGFLKKCEERVHKKNFHSYVMLYLNIRDFRHINESWGEAEGNKVLNFIFKNLKIFMKEEELVCRSGLDHFLLLLREESDSVVCSRVQEMVHHINAQIEENFPGEEMEFTIGACRLFEEKNFARSMNRAIYASTTEADKNTCIFFSKEVKRRAERAYKIEELFEESIQNHDFHIYLQPKVSLQQKQESVPCAAEVLVRWIHPKEGMILPGEFIPQLERNGKINELDMYVFEESCKLVAGWIRDKKPISKISVNLSRFHLKSEGKDVWKPYQKLKESYHIPDDIIEIEITETGLLEHNQINFVKQILKDFRTRGFLVSLDDFGFAYSSLALLKAFDVDILKLDREFFVDENSKSRKIVDGVIHLAHKLNMQVVAEGIEETEQLEALREMDCDFVQGYVFSKPLPVEQFEVWRANNRFSA